MHMQSCFSKQSLMNRQSPALYRALSHLLGTSDLIASHDKYIAFRPTVGNEARRSDRNLHFDCNPWSAVGVPVTLSEKLQTTGQDEKREQNKVPYIGDERVSTK